MICWSTTFHCQQLRECTSLAGTPTSPSTLRAARHKVSAVTHNAPAKSTKLYGEVRKRRLAVANHTLPARGVATGKSATADKARARRLFIGIPQENRGRHAPCQCSKASTSAGGVTERLGVKPTRVRNVLPAVRITCPIEKEAAPFNGPLREETLTTGFFGQPI